MFDWVKEVTAKNLRIVAYLRVSTEEQKRNETIQLQRMEMTRLLKAYEIELTETYEDDGVTGTIALDRRPAGSRLLADAQLQRFDIVLIWRLDRLARDARHILNGIHELESLNVRVRGVSDNFDASTPEGKFHLTVLAGVAAMERDKIVERTALGKAQAMREGRPGGRLAPYGYQAQGAKRTRHFIHATDPLEEVGMSEVDVVHWIWDHVTRDQGSCCSAALWLNTHGIPTRSQLDGRRCGHGKDPSLARWTPSVIRAMLLNPLYKGSLRAGHRAYCGPCTKRRGITTYRGSKLCPHNWEADHEVTRTIDPELALISEEQWEWACRRLVENRQFSRRNQKREYLLAGVIRCGYCGANYVGLPSIGADGKDRPKYACGRNHRVDVRCGGLPQACALSKSTVAAKLDREVWELLLDCLAHPEETIRRVMEEQTAATEKRLQDVGAMSRLRAQLEETKQEEERSKLMFRKGYLKEHELDAALAEIVQQRRQVDHELALVQGRESAFRDRAQEMERLKDLIATSHAHAQTNLSFDQKRQLVRHFVKEVVITTGEVNGVPRAQAEVVFRFTPGKIGSDGVFTSTSELSNRPNCVEHFLRLALAA